MEVAERNLWCVSVSHLAPQRCSRGLWWHWLELLSLHTEAASEVGWSLLPLLPEELPLELPWCEPVQQYTCQWVTVS